MKIFLLCCLANILTVWLPLYLSFRMTDKNNEEIIVRRKSQESSEQEMKLSISVNEARELARKLEKFDSSSATMAFFEIEKAHCAGDIERVWALDRRLKQLLAEQEGKKA